MGGERLGRYWTNEMEAMFASYRQFETLIPAKLGGGAAHRGEDGRYVESLLKETLKKFLPSGIEILTGFILRAGISSEFSGKARRNDGDAHSSQLDLIVYDTQNYPVYQRFGDTAVVLPEGVIAVISVKKTLRERDLQHEIIMLQQVANLCSFRHWKGPFLALVGITSENSIHQEKGAGKVFSILEECTQMKKPVCYQEMPGFIGSLDKWTIHKVHKKSKHLAEYQLYMHKEDEKHLGLQYLLKGILDIYYSTDRNHGKQPGYISFTKSRGYDGESKKICYDCEEKGSWENTT